MNRNPYLAAMDITQWQLRTDSCAAAQLKQAHVQDEAVDTSVNHAWTQLQQRVVSCTACPLHQTRTRAVFGVGNQRAALLLVGEAPGQQEDLAGEPFVGRAGQLLNAMLEAIQMPRSAVYIANIVKSRPPHNREPTTEEIKQCIPFLYEQIRLIKPQLIVTLGRIAAHSLLNTQQALGKLRRRMFTYGTDNIPTLVTYHPAYLLRNPLDKRKAQEDWWLIRESLKNLSVAQKQQASL